MKQFAQYIKEELDFFNNIKAKGTDGRLSSETIVVDGTPAKIAVMLKYKGLEQFLAKNYVPGQSIAGTLQLVEKLCAEYAHLEPVRLIELCCRVVAATSTQGVVTVPVEGLVSIELEPTEGFLIMNFAGPIRAAGASTIGLLLCLAQWLRQKFNIPKYTPTTEELRRCVTESLGYPKSIAKPSVKNLQLVLTNYPLMVSGPATELEEVSAYKFLPRIKTPKYRGGYCLVIECMLIKASKILKIAQDLQLQWGWLKEVDENKSKNLAGGAKDVITSSIGRPIISSATSKAGLRLRVGRSANVLLGGCGLHPATIKLIGFTNIGGQLVTTYPGKGTITNPCTDLTPPLVYTEKGIHHFNESDDIDKIHKILDLGQILLSFGEFCEFNRAIPKRDYCKGLWRTHTNYQIDESLVSDKNILELQKQYPNAKLHPDYNIFLDCLSAAQYSRLRSNYSRTYPSSFETLFVKAKIPFSYNEAHQLVPLNPNTLAYILMVGEPFDVFEALEYASLTQYVNAHYASVNKTRVGEKGCAYLNARIGRAQSVHFRHLKPDCNILAPSPYSKKTALTLKDLDVKSKVTVKRSIRFCFDCKQQTTNTSCETCNARVPVVNYCTNCNTHFLPEQAHESCSQIVSHIDSEIDYEKELVQVLKQLRPDKDTKLKFLESGVKMNHIQPLIKGILRAKHALPVSRDGTIRVNVSNAATTHFRPKDVPSTSIKTLIAMGYTQDVDGAPLTHQNQILSLKLNDCIMGVTALKELQKIANFIDDLLAYHYKTERYYNAHELRDLIGTSVLSLAPHISSAVFLRIIGYTEINAYYCHPIAVAVRRRNLDGDQDLVMLSGDVYLNFSYSYVDVKKIGALMNLPITASTRMYVKEVDKQFLNVETGKRYPDLPNSRQISVKELSDVPRVVSETKDAEKISYDYNTPGFLLSLGHTKNLYKDLHSSIEKFEKVLELQKLLEIEHLENVISLLEGHLLRDLVGNTNAYFRQYYKCNGCGYKCYMPLNTNCVSCKSTNLRNTVYPRMVSKYVGLIKRLLNEYALPTYLVQKLQLSIENIRPFLEEDTSETATDLLEQLFK